MSVNLDKKGNWMTAHYDSLSVVVTLIVLLVSIAVLLLQIDQGNKALAQGDWEKPRGQVLNATPVDLTTYESVSETLENPHQVDERSRDTFVSETRVASINPDSKPFPIPYTAKVCPFSGHPQPALEEWDTDLDGLPDSYELEHGLDPKDGADALADTDGDRFSNIEEFRSGTSPSDRKSFPSPIARLRLAKAKTTPFVLKFEGVQELPTGTKFQLNLRSRERTFFVSLGEEVEGFKVDAYEERIRKGPYGPIDESVLTLRHGEQFIKLTKGKEISKHEWSALLIWLVDGKRIPVRVEQEFELKGSKYKVIDIAANRILIRDSASGGKVVIKKLSSSERQTLVGDESESEAVAGDEAMTSAARSAPAMPDKTVRRPAAKTSTRPPVRRNEFQQEIKNNESSRRRRSY